MWSYLISLTDIPDGKVLPNGDVDPNSFVSVQLRANESVCQDLADRLMVPSVQSVVADVQVYRQVGQRTLICVACDFTANVHLTCGVTLETFATTLNDTLVQDFTTKEMIPQDEEDDVPEYIEGRELDLADIVVQLVALSIPAYPRAPHADLQGIIGDKSGVNEDIEKRNPFAKLSDFKKRL